MRLPVRIALRPSLSLTLLLGAAHGGACLGIALTPVSIVMKVAAGCVLALTLAIAIHRSRNPGIRALTLHGDGRLVIDAADGVPRDAQVRAGSTVLPGLVVLLLQVDGKPRTLTLLPDSFGADGFRQMRLWLRWKAAAAVVA